MVSRASAFVLAFLLAACGGSGGIMQEDGAMMDPAQERAAMQMYSHYPVGGRHKPSLTGGKFLRVLAVFIRFAGDTVRTPTWPDPDVLPEWASHIVDSSVAGIGSHAKNISAFFDEDSRGRFHLIGDVFYVTTDSSEEYYHTRIPGDEVMIRGKLARDVLMKLAPRADFRRYDNWRHRADHEFVFESDSIADMIWLLTRSYSQNPYAADDARRRSFREFHRTAADFNLDGALSIDGVRVNPSSGNVYGDACGLTVLAANNDKPVYIYDSATTSSGRPSLTGELIHEFSHYLFGPGHFGDGNVSLSANRYASFFTGYACNSSNAFGHHHALEKMKLGWISERPGDGIRSIGLDEEEATVDLSDAADRAPGNVYAVKIPVRNSDQYFLLEYRGWAGDFEGRFVPYNSPRARLRPGVLVTHVIEESPYFAATKARVVCADGRFRWRVASFSRSPGENNARDRILRDSADARAGYDEREKIYSPGYSRYWYAGAWQDPDGRQKSGGPYADCTNCADGEIPAADNVGDAYDLFQEGDVLSPWSNPNCGIWDGKGFSVPNGSGFTVRVERIDVTRKRAAVTVRRVRLEEVAPSSPKGLRVDTLIGGAPRLCWSPNAEPAVASRPGAVYELQRSLDGRHFEDVAEVAHPSLQWTEGRTALNRATSEVYYRLRVRDSAGRVSPYGELVRVRL